MEDRKLTNSEIQFKKYGKLIPDALTVLKNEIHPIDFIITQPLKRLNYIVNFIRKEKPTIFKKYLTNLEKKFFSLIKEDCLAEKKLNTEELLNNFDELKRHPELVRNYINYILQTLGLSKKDDWINDKVEVIHRDYLLGFLLPKYYNLEVLTETIDRDEAIRLYKILVTQYIIDNSSPNRKIFDKVDEFKEYFEKDKKEVTVGWIGVLSEISDGKFFFRKDNCLWAEALEDIPDKELKYLICCYGDFQAANSRSRGNFAFTMKHTIVEDDPYCDCIYHDTNISWDLTHPPKEFWDSIETE